MKRLAFLLLFLTASPLLAAENGAWQQEWERVLAAAKREGKVAITGPGGREPRRGLVDPFQEKYGITVEYFGATGRQVGPRVMTERRAGYFLWDVYVGGTTTALSVMIPQGAFAPLEPALITPEVKDPANWRGDSLEFLDKARRLVIMTPQQVGVMSANTDLVKIDEIKSYKDILEPKWKGKIVMDDPRRSGPGQGSATFFYMHPELGIDFLRALARQEPLLSRDFVQQVDLVAHGRYSILIGVDVLVQVRAKQGAPIAIVEPLRLGEGSHLSPKDGAAALYSNPPHPNAAKVYMNWLLSREGQTAFAQSMGYVSARKDVSTSHVPAWRVPQPGSIRTYTEEGIEIRDRLLPLLREIFGR